MFLTPQERSRLTGNLKTKQVTASAELLTNLSVPGTDFVRLAQPSTLKMLLGATEPANTERA
jgi:hypothetical protein